MKKYILFLFVFIICPTEAFSQNISYNCNIFKLIVEGIELKKRQDTIYPYIKDSIRTVREYSKVEIFTNSKLSQKKVDSLVAYSRLDKLFKIDELADSLFHLKKYVVLLDTFNFFDKCSLNIKNPSFSFVNNGFNQFIDKKSLDTSFIVLKSIRVHHNGLILSFQDCRSKFEIEFVVMIIANMEPVVVSINRCYPLRPLKKPTEEEQKAEEELWQKLSDDIDNAKKTDTNYFWRKWSFYPIFHRILGKKKKI